MLPELIRLLANATDGTHAIPGTTAHAARRAVVRICMKGDHQVGVREWEFGTAVLCSAWQCFCLPCCRLCP